MRVRRSREEWQKLIEEQKESRKSIAGFCEEKGIHPNLFYRKIKTVNNSGTFVRVPGLKISQKAITITCRNISVNIAAPVTRDDIVMILTSMKEAGYVELS